MSSLPALKLKPAADKRLRAGHHWIYSNEVNTDATPLTDMTPGQQVNVLTHQDKVIGTAMVNPYTLICGRLISRQANQVLDKSLLVHRLNIALSLREQSFDAPYYRLVYGDSDGLSGLVIDRFGETIVIQISTAGMEAVRDDIIDAIEQVCKPEVIVLKNDGKMRETEQLENYTTLVKGSIDDTVKVIENGVSMLSPVMSGQKTGWFYDHRDSRAAMQQYVKDKRVLDVFSYVGGWGIQAAAAGAEDVICVDSSESALDTLIEAASQNGFEQVAAMQADAFDAMKALNEDKEKFDVVILDPPAFISRRKDHKAGLRAYAKANQLAMRLVNKDGILISGSCSMHLMRDQLADTLRQTSRQIERHGQIIGHYHQGSDHPIHPAIPETEYLKSIFMRVLPTL